MLLIFSAVTADDKDEEKNVAKATAKENDYVVIGHWLIGEQCNSKHNILWDQIEHLVN